ncbi:NAD-binding protein [Fomitiporia mediterranea MF3/22]|uniref:NAD-binding protein n=1 Tax=Fomitiporia mediterranea (strain MF3/22) TaxID=694068 RepID=UPI00044095DF|nr:NAD-binding protein [Fomitiporia mediterranea MF3/22]EJD04805.1 NAD-binding protein [Fomitiporia mediterranea MF3/22]
MANNATFRTSNLFNVEDWVCVVTGGGTGIGLMAAQAFANNGARVYITSRRKSTLEQAFATHGQSLVHPKGAIIPVSADVTDKASIEQLVAEIGKRESHVDVLVNNAGITKGTSEVEKGDEDAAALSKVLWDEEIVDWEDVYRTNVIGPFFTTVRFLPLLAASAGTKAAHRGVVINITSMSGITRTSQHHFKYNVSKSAAIHLSALLAQECRRTQVNVRVNKCVLVFQHTIAIEFLNDGLDSSIAPGIFPSEMTTEGSDETNKSELPVDESYGAKKGIPAGRPGRDEDMAQAILALACNQYAYGSTFTIDGGYLLEHP